MISSEQTKAERSGQRSSADVRRNTITSSGTEDLVAALFGILIVVALYLDGRAHVLGLPDSFFTPWHAFLYGGLLLFIAWLAVISRRAATRHRLARVAVIPAGYGYAVVGAGLFTVGGVSDLIWHQIFGVEFGLDALLSPTHLLLFVGGALMLTGPVRAFHGPAVRLTMVTRVSATLAVLGITAIAAFALSFLSGFITDSATFAVGRAPSGTEAHILAESLAEAGLGSYVITTLVLVIPLVYLERLRLATVGTTSLLVTSVALLATTLENFQNTGIVIAAFGAAALTDVALLALRRVHVSLRAQELALAALLPLLLWSGQLLVTNMTQGVLWSLEMVTGVVIVSALAAFATVFVLGPVPTAETNVP